MSRFSDIKVHDGVIPMRWNRLLRQYVARHETELSLCWYELEQRPRNFLEQVIAYLRPIAKPGDACVGAEYWSRAQPASSSFHFHFDRDETVTDHVVSPTLSTIVYLSDVGGPTLIVDATPARRRAPTRGVGVFPRPRRLTTFPGELFHGVSAGEPSRWPRIAFFVNWWARRPAACVDPPSGLARQCPVVREHRTPSVRPRRFSPESFDPGVLISAADWRALLARAQVIAGYGPATTGR